MRWTISGLLDSIWAWNSATVALDVPFGMSRDEAERRALAILDALGRRGPALPALDFTEELPDVLYALCEALAPHASAEQGEVLTGLYELVAKLSWPQDEFGEKAELLAQISQLAWSRSLGRGDASETLRWEEASVENLLSRESCRQLLSAPVSDWSSVVCGRFLADRALLLGLCIWLRNRSNSNIGAVFELASSVFVWLSTRAGDHTDREEDAYLLAELAVLVANTARFSGRHGQSREWLTLAEQWSEISKDPLTSGARVEYARLALLYDTYQFSAVLSRVSPLVEKFLRLGLNENVVKSKFLKAMVLKDLNRDDESLQLLSELEGDPAVTRQPLLLGLVLVGIADLQNRTGRPAAALGFVQKGEMVLREAGMSFAFAHSCGVTGEILRDQGRWSEALNYYRRAVEIYLDADMMSLAAYSRLLLAETLVATRRDGEAVKEILAALPIIEREGLVREGIVAVGLLKASVSRRKLDPAALKALRESLDRSRRRLES